jgi:hypothetical protein
VTKRRLGVVGLILLMIAVAIWVVLPRHGGASGPAGHAREAAQRGSFDAIIQIGPQLQASQMDPDEVAAWNLTGAILSQQGCSYGGLTVQWMTSTSNTLSSNRVSDKVKALADQYWQQYGAQMMANIGCT